MQGPLPGDIYDPSGQAFAVAAKARSARIGCRPGAVEGYFGVPHSIALAEIVKKVLDPWPGGLAETMDFKVARHRTGGFDHEPVVGDELMAAEVA